MNQVSTQNRGSLRAWLDKKEVRKAINDSLAGWMDGDQFVAQIVVALNNPDFDDCTPESKFFAAQECASLGMLPNLDQVALIPRNIKGKGRCVTAMPQWQGFQALMLRVPGVRDVRAQLVHSTDEYVWDSEAELITVHKYDPFDPERKFNTFKDLRGGYLTVEWDDQSRPNRQHMVPVEAMQKARACAQGDGIWTKWFKEQCLKTVYRNAYARRVVPIDPLVNQRLDKATSVEDEVLGNDPNRVVDPTKPLAITEQPASRTEQLVSSMAPKAIEVTPEPAPEKEQEPKQEKTKAKKTPPKKTKPKEEPVAEDPIFQQLMRKITECSTSEACDQLAHDMETYGNDKTISEGEFMALSQSLAERASEIDSQQ